MPAEQAAGHRLLPERPAAPARAPPMPSSQRVIASRSRVPSQPRRSQTLAEARWVVRFSSFVVSVHACESMQVRGQPSGRTASDGISYTLRQCHQQRMGFWADRRSAAAGPWLQNTPVLRHACAFTTALSAKMSRGISVAPWRVSSLATRLEVPDDARAHIELTEEVLRRVQGEFLEMPGLRLTEPQAPPSVGSSTRPSCDALARRPGRREVSVQDTRRRVHACRARRRPSRASMPAAPLPEPPEVTTFPHLRNARPSAGPQVLPLSRQPAGRTAFRHSPGGRPSGRRPRNLQSHQRFQSGFYESEQSRYYL